MPARWTTIESNGAEVGAYTAFPPTPGPHPAVIVVQEIWGLNGYIQSIANRLAAQGYFAIAPDLFHREGPGTIGLFEETELAFERLGRLRDDEILADLRAAMAFLDAQPNLIKGKVGIVGFCVGGRIAYQAAANIQGLGAAVDFYGGRMFMAFGEGPSPFEQTKGIAVPLLGLFGEDDQNPTAAEVETMKQELEHHGRDFEFHVYPGAGHGFNCEERPTYRRDASLHAWGKAIEWFDRHLRG